MTPHSCLIVFAAITVVGCNDADVATAPVTPTTKNAPAPQDEVTSMTDQWPFQDATNTAVITLRRIMDGSKPILYVVHDEEGDWQFLDGGDVSEEDANLVSLESITELDPTVNALADLPTGWAAERTAADKSWERFKR